MPLSPYFQSMTRRKRLCPQCLERATRIEPLDGGGLNAAFEVCDCGYRQLLQAPKSAWVEPPDVSRGERQRLVDELNDGLRRKREAEPPGRVIQVDFGRRSR